MTRGTATFLSLLCLLVLFTETFAPVCEPEIFRSEFDDSYDSFPDSLEPDDCVWSEWGFWSVCSYGVRSRYRTKESRTWRCRCGGPYIQTKPCSNIVHQPGEFLNLRSSSFNFIIIEYFANLLFNFSFRWNLVTNWNLALPGLRSVAHGHVG